KVIQQRKHPGAMTEIGKDCVIHSDYSNAVFWFREAAELGYAEAQRCLGNQYFYGRGIGKDFVEAAKWYRLSAEGGDEEGQYNLGLLFDLGLGVEQDDRAAFGWYSKSAEQGKRVANFALASMYELGIGVEQDVDKALNLFQSEASKISFSNCRIDHVEWLTSPDYRLPTSETDAVALYREGAKKGYSAAQYNLGRMYEKGRGVSKNTEQALKWYDIARKNHHRFSSEREPYTRQVNRGPTVYTSVDNDQQ
ncbi:hypothetical protein BGW41_007665, partial [Actinomortierella wolfii]